MHGTLTRSFLRAALAVATVALLSACNSTPKTTAAPAAPAGGGKHVDPATAGEISGRVTFTGTPPKPQAINMGIDAGCMQGQTKPAALENVEVGPNGGLGNVFVYVKDGVDPSYSFDVPTDSVTLDQKGCMYEPHVMGVRVGQPIELLNSDPTMHNVHAMPKENQEFNHGFMTRGVHMSKTFTVPEQMVLIKCNVHSWMTAYIGVMATPFFGVTSADGTFDLKGLPPGTYTLAAWHEKYGTQTQKITIGDHQTQNATFTFSAAASQ